jgi:type IV pilus assembly protein PilE
MSHIKLNFGIVRRRCERAGGFTLIEAMVTVAIVAILAAVALPVYSDYVQRSKISEAVSSLSDMRTRLEQFFLDNRAYPTSCVASGAVAPQINLPTQKYFTVSCAFPTLTTYTITATGVAAQGMSTAFKYTINEANARVTTGLPSTWPGHTMTPISCWAIRKDGSC